jgi:hypothetical protein
MSDWIDWNGGECPVVATDVVEIQWATGSSTTGPKADIIDWNSTDKPVRYRVLNKPAPDQIEMFDKPAALARQEEGGGHYKAMKIQPFEYIHANGIPFAEGCVIKYVSRWRAKGGVEDLKKARHFLDLLIEAESK